jgi:hypothetical protein
MTREATLGAVRSEVNLAIEPRPRNLLNMGGVGSDTAEIMAVAENFCGQKDVQTVRSGRIIVWVPSAPLTWLSAEHAIARSGMGATCGLAVGQPGLMVAGAQACGGVRTVITDGARRRHRGTCQAGDCRAECIALE